MKQEEAAQLVNALFTEWGPFLARYGLRMTGSVELSEDLIQEAFLALYRDLRSGKCIDNPKAWTFGAVRNQVRKHARYVRRHAEDLESPEILDQIPAEPRWPDVVSEVANDAPIGLSVLTVREEEVILLRLQSLKYREIAAELGISSKSVCTLLARAVKKLQIASASSRSSAVKRLESEVRDALH